MTDPPSARALWDFDPTAPPEVVYFPVRHYSPASARLLWDVARAISPAAVLIEGPSNFNDRIEELAMPGHELPIALYSWVRMSDDTKRAAFHPFCDYAPEWQALLVAREHGVPAYFIDLPWQQVARMSSGQHRFSDRHFNINPYPPAVCERVGATDFDELWDILFELDGDLDWRGYMRRAHEFCWNLRAFAGEISVEDAAREDCMVRHVDDVVDELGGPVLVVTGGFHSSGLWALREDIRLPVVEAESMTVEVELHGDADEEEDPPTVVDAGITLTPFTYERIDHLCGYAAGVHGPAFYQYVWTQRCAGASVDSRDFLYTIIGELRDRGQVASTADVVAVESTARALAALRGREEIWRFDLLDAMSAALVKEAQDAEYMHPMLRTAREVLRGSRRGRIDPNAPLPPLVASIRALMQDHDLSLGIGAVDRELELDLTDPADRERSRILYQCRALGIAGLSRSGGTDFTERDDLTEIWEAWDLRWSPDFEATLIEAATYGVDLPSAATARVLELAAREDANADTASALAIEAALMGLREVAHALYEQLAALVDADGDFFRVSRALGHVLYLHGYDELLGSKQDPLIAALLLSAYQRTLWLFEGAGASDQDQELVSAIGTLHHAYRTTYAHDLTMRDEYVGVMRRSVADDRQPPAARGAATGSLFTLGELADDLTNLLAGLPDPIAVGDFLRGLFSLAREAVRRDERLIWVLDQLVCTTPWVLFMELLPAWRLAFTFFTPREKHDLVDVLFGERTTDQPPDAAAVAEGLRLDQRIRTTAAQFGLRLPMPRASAIAAPDEVDVEAAAHLQAIGDDERRTRWRLILGAEGDTGAGLDGSDKRRDRLLEFLYEREYGPRRNVRGQRGPSPGASVGERGRGGMDDSRLSVPEWINGIHELFPKRTIERMEQDALDRYAIEEIVTRPDVLQRATPNPTLLKAVLRTRHLMDGEVLQIARQLVRKVVDELMDKLAQEIQQPFSGARDRRRRSNLRVAKNFDARETVRRNLKHWDAGAARLLIREPFFYSRVRRHTDRWQVIIVVDQSGSMLDSVIHSAVMASVFHGLKALRTHLVAFDTNIVDLTSDVGDPVELLMRVQLGGGTDIANALTYAESLVDAPARTIVVLLTDFCEGGRVAHLLAVTQRLIESGVKLVGLASLDREANPVYDREIAGQMARLGAHVGAMTPGELAAWISEQVR